MISKTHPNLPAGSLTARSVSGGLGTPVGMSMALAVCTLAVFCSAAWNGFVNYDDPDYVTSNPHVLSGLEWGNVKWAFTTGHASNWHPLTWLSHMLDCQFFGQNAAEPHLVNIAFHVANAVLLFLVLRKMTGAHWTSAFVAALFALHPEHVESVAWVSERKDVLSTFFFLLTVAAYTKFAESPHQAPLPGGSASRSAQAPHLPFAVSPRRFYFLSMVCFALRLMSKPMLVTVPFLLLLLDWWPLGRLKVGPGNSSVPPLRLLIEKVPFLALSVGSCVVTYVVQQRGGAVSTSLTFGQRIANALVSYARYIGKTFWPQNLSVLYPHPGDWPVGQVVSASAVLLAITVLVLLLGRSRPYLAVGWFWFLGALVPVIGLVQVGIQSMADRYTYMPAIGLYIMFAWGASETLSTLERGRRFLAATALLAFGACGVLTVRQIQYWRTSETLFRRATEVTDRNYLAFNNLGYYLQGRGKIDEAMDNYRKALEINPRYEDALNNLGYALAASKRPAEAIPYYEAALKIRPTHVEVHNNLGNALSELGRIQEAIAHYNFVLREQPDHADANNNLGIALAMQGHLDQALEHFRAAIRSKPDYASAHSNLGNGLAAQHKFPEAIAEYQESLRLNPKDAQAHNNLGNVLAEENQLNEAIPEYLEAIRLNAENPEAQFNLGVVFARLGKKAEAAQHYQEALRLKPDYAAARQQLDALRQSR